MTPITLLLVLASCTTAAAGGGSGVRQTSRSAIPPHPHRLSSSSLAAAQTASSPHGPICAKYVEKSSTCERFYSIPLTYKGGRVLHEPKLYLIWWGNNWLSTEEGRTWRARLKNTYGGLTEQYGLNLTYQHVLENQYWDNNGPISKVTLAGEYVETAFGAAQGQNYADIALTVEYAIEHNGWPRGPENQYVVLHPPGTVYQPAFVHDKEGCDGKGENCLEVGCGFHQVDSMGSVYAFIPDRANQEFSDKCATEIENPETHKFEHIYGREETEVASHEYAEATTDPYGGRGHEEPAWSNEEPIGEPDSEIADICDLEPETLNAITGIYVSAIWSNSEYEREGAGRGCVIKDPPEPLPPAPSAVTGVVSGITATEATLAGTVNPNGPDAHYYFEYGPSTSYGQRVPAPPGGDAGFGKAPVPISAKLTGLQAGVTYHYRLVASSWAGTSYGADATFATSPWSILVTPNPVGAQSSYLDSVSCRGSSFCMAVGGYSKETAPNTPIMMAQRWNGKSWTVQEIPNPGGSSFLNSVSCPSSTTCVAVGTTSVSGRQATLAEQWSEGSWRVVKTPSPPPDVVAPGLRGVSCSSATACTAMGEGQTEIGPNEGVSWAERWNGSNWSVEGASTTTGRGALGVSCASAKSCTAVGGSGLSEKGRPFAEHWNGVTWSTQGVPSPSGEPSPLFSVSCWTSKECMAVGYSLETKSNWPMYAERWNGTSWELQTLPQQTGSKYNRLNSVSCKKSTTATTCTAVGWTLSAPVNAIGVRWNGAWTIDAVPTPTGAKASQLEGVSCWSTSMCVGVGSYQDASGHSVTLAELYHLSG